MKKLLLLLFLTVSISASGQEYQDLSTIKFWTCGNDTGYAILEQANGIERTIVDRIRVKDTVYEYYISGNLKGKGAVALEKTETIFQPDGEKQICSTYEYYGQWIVYYDTIITRVAQIGLYRNHNKVENWTSYYFNGVKKEVIVYSDAGKLIEKYDTLGHLVNKTEYIWNGFGDLKTVEEIKYDKGKPVFVVNESSLARTLHKNAKIIMIVFFITFFGRILINHIIYNREEMKSNQLFHIPGYNSRSDTFFHGIRCMLTFWWFRYDKRNKTLVYLSLLFSIVAIGIFLTLLISGV